MSISDALQLAALILLPLAVFLVLLGISESLLIATGFTVAVLAGEFWFVGRELDLRGGDET